MFLFYYLASRYLMKEIHDDAVSKKNGQKMSDLRWEHLGALNSLGRLGEGPRWHVIG